MNRITFARISVLMLVVAGLALQGCGGDDAYSISAADQARIDALTADLAAANQKADGLEGDLAAANTQIGNLQGQLTTAETARDTAQTEVGRLMGVIGMPADGDTPATGLHLQIATKEAEITDLKTEIGTMSTDDAEATGLYKKLEDAEAMRDTYMATLGMPADAAAGTEATGLYKDLADAEADLADYKTLVGSKDDEASTEEGASLYAMLNAKQDEVDDLSKRLQEANNDLAKLRSEDVVEDNIERGEAIMDLIYARIDGTTGLPTDSGPVMSVSAACAGGTCSNHQVAVDDGEIQVTGFAGTTSRRGAWLNATLTGVGSTAGQTIEAYADSARNDATDLVYYGWWLDEPGVVSDPHDLSVFAGGSNPIADISKFANISGEATYEGMAAGQYAAEIRTAGMRTDMDSGSFTANVALTADFGEAVQQNPPHLAAIAGTINAFDVSGAVDPSLWAITLKDASKNDEGKPIAFSNDTMFMGEATLSIGGLDGRDGMWQGQFYRARTEDIGNQTGIDVAPGAVAGTFGIEDRQLSIIGAFGAHVDDD